MRLLGILALALLLASSAFSPGPSIPHHWRNSAASLYEWWRTPAYILKGLACTESDECDSAIGDDGFSKGRFQINERFHSYYAWRYGEYDPHKPLDALRIASCLFQDNLAALGDETLAIAAHNQGCGGVRKHGPNMFYVNRVRRKG